MANHSGDRWKKSRTGNLDLAQSTKDMLYAARTAELSLHRKRCIRR